MAESEEENKLSESLFGRKNLSRKMGFLGFARKCKDQNSNKLIVADYSKKNKWSDCGCDSCLSWMNDEDHKLFIVVREPSLGNSLKIPPFNFYLLRIYYVYELLSFISSFIVIKNVKQKKYILCFSKNTFD